MISINKCRCSVSPTSIKRNDVTSTLMRRCFNSVYNYTLMYKEWMWPPNHENFVQFSKHYHLWNSTMKYLFQFILFCCLWVVYIWSIDILEKLISEAALGLLEYLQTCYSLQFLFVVMITFIGKQNNLHLRQPSNTLRLETDRSRDIPMPRPRGVRRKIVSMEFFVLF